MKKIEITTRFTKNCKTLRKKHFDNAKLNTVINLLASGATLPGKYKDHALTGDWQGFRECHIERDWLLIYQTDETSLILVATGSHDDLFK